MVRRAKVQGLGKYCAANGLEICASHMRRGQLRMALRLLPWVAERVFETFVPAQEGSEMKSLAGRLIQVLCCKGGRIYFGWVA